MLEIGNDEQRSCEYRKTRDKRLPGKETRKKDGLSELREWDFRLTSHYRRTWLKEWLIREFNGTPRTLFLFITSPFWVSWMLIKSKKQIDRKNDEE